MRHDVSEQRSVHYRFFVDGMKSMMQLYGAVLNSGRYVDVLCLALEPGQLYPVRSKGSEEEEIVYNVVEHGLQKRESWLTAVLGVRSISLQKKWPVEMYHKRSGALKAKRKSLCKHAVPF